MSDDLPDFGPWPSIAYVGSPLDRGAEKRGDPRFLEAARKRPDTRIYVAAGDFVVLARRDGGLDPLFLPMEAEGLGLVPESFFLGFAGEAVRLGSGISPETAAQLQARSDLLVTDLRTVAIKALIQSEHLQPLATTKALFAWHARHRFCANCGAPTRSTEAGWRRDCDSCSVQHFPRTDPCVIMLAIDGERCLLGRQTRFPPGMWSCLAGFVEPGESFEEAVRRELREEAGVETGRVRYFASQPWPYATSLMIGCHAEATATKLTIDHDEIEDARWIPRKEVALMLLRKHPDGIFTPAPSAIAHHLIRAYVERGTGLIRANADEA